MASAGAVVGVILVDPQQFNLAEGLDKLVKVASSTFVAGVVAELIKRPVPRLAREIYHEVNEELSSDTEEFIRRKYEVR